MAAVEEVLDSVVWVQRLAGTGGLLVEAVKVELETEAGVVPSREDVDLDLVAVAMGPAE